MHSRQRSFPGLCCPSPAGASDTGGRVRGESSPATGCRQEGCGETAAGQMRSARWGAERRGAAGCQAPRCWVSSLLRAQATRSRWLHRASFWVGNRSRKVSWTRTNYCSVFFFFSKKISLPMSDVRRLFIRSHSLRQRKDSNDGKESRLKTILLSRSARPGTKRSEI